MKKFSCSHCGQPIYFENTECLNCGHSLGYLPELDLLSAFEKEQNESWKALIPEAGEQRYKMCQNYAQTQICNWMVPLESASVFCKSCQLTRTIPNMEKPESKALWYRLEVAKRRLLYTFFSLKLPVIGKHEDVERGLAFEFLDPDPNLTESDHAITGHDHGLITINLAEADDAVREQTRQNMNEPYRALLGHFRHESGHYYWDLLIQDNEQWLSRYRELFGDEREDYGQALQRHYQEGSPPGWQQNFISAYASSHPWEDWAEVWAHYLHMIDTLETAEAVGLQIDKQEVTNPALEETPVNDRDMERIFDALIDNWFPLTFAVNSINRSMGLNDLYPFLLPDSVIEKLRFIHQVVHHTAKHFPETIGSDKSHALSARSAQQPSSRNRFFDFFFNSRANKD
jgi:hypothetical protein